MITEGVTSIGNEAFGGCTSLTDISVSPNNSAYTSVDGILYNKERTQLIAFPAAKNVDVFEIPDTVTSIGYMAFYDCTSLTSIVIPEGVTSIGDAAFRGCTSLKEVHLSAKPSIIEPSAFEGLDGCILYVPAGSKKAYRKMARLAGFAEVKGE